MNQYEQHGERRSDDRLTKAIERLQATLDDKHRQNTDHLAAIGEKVERVLADFPDGDPESHRRFHEALIHKAESREKFWSDLRGKLIERGIFAMLIFLGGLLLLGFGAWIKGVIGK